MLDGPDRSLTRPAGQRLSQWANCECLAWCSLLRKVNLPPRGPRPTFRCLRTTFLRRVLSCSLIAMCKPVSKTIFFRPTGEWEKRRQRHGSVQPQTSWISSGLACFFFSLSKPSQSMRMVLAIRLFEAEKTSALCTLNFYDVQCTPVKRRSPWGNPKNRGKPQESANQRARYF